MAFFFIYDDILIWGHVIKKAFYIIYKQGGIEAAFVNLGRGAGNKE